MNHDDAIDEAMEIWNEIQEARERVQAECRALDLPKCESCRGLGYTWEGTEDGNAYREVCPICKGLGYGREKDVHPL